MKAKGKKKRKQSSSPNAPSKVKVFIVAFSFQQCTHTNLGPHNINCSASRSLYVLNWGKRNINSSPERWRGSLLSFQAPAPYCCLLYPSIRKHTYFLHMPIESVWKKARSSWTKRFLLKSQAGCPLLVAIGAVHQVWRVPFHNTTEGDHASTHAPEYTCGPHTGGVFLALLKQQVTAETWKEIFAEVCNY